MENKPLWQMILDGEATELDIARARKETDAYLAQQRMKIAQEQALERARHAFQPTPPAILLFRRK